MPRRFTLLLSLFLLAPGRAAEPVWTPPTAEELAQTDSSIEPGAGAEILSLYVSIDDSDGFTAEYKHHLRAKIFNAKGAEDFLSHKIFYDEGTTVRKIEARTYKPDGTTVILDKKAILDQQIIRTNDFKGRAKVITLPGVEPGCIIELRWSLDRENVMVVPMKFQEEYPAKLIQYDFVPSDGAGFNSIIVNYPGDIPKEDKKGRYVFKVKDMARFKTEPYALPESQLSSHLVVWYTNDYADTLAQYWANCSQALKRVQDKFAQPRKDIATLARSLVGSAISPEEKLQALYLYCTTKIKNRQLAYAGFTTEQNKKFKPNETPSATLKAGHGTASDINLLFIALAQSLGIEARVAMVSDQSYFKLNINHRQNFLLQHLVVAVRTGEDKWSFYDPGSIFLPCGMLQPRHEGGTALIASPRLPIYAHTPFSRPEQSALTRRATLTVTADGTLSGEVTCDYLGHDDYLLKMELQGKTAEEQENIIKQEITARLPLAEVSALKIENSASPDLPLKVSYQLKCPGYADRTGKRLIVQPAFFQKGVPARFTAARRVHPIYFSRSRTTHDEISLSMPSDHRIEQSTRPHSVYIGAIGSCEISLGSTLHGQLLHKRTFVEKNFLTSPDYYPQIKQAFDDLHAQDNHACSFREISTE